MVTGVSRRDAVRQGRSCGPDVGKGWVTAGHAHERHRPIVGRGQALTSGAASTIRVDEGLSPVIRPDRELLADLARFNRAVPGFALAYVNGEVTPFDELAFAEQLAQLADAIRQHAEDRRRLVIDGGPSEPPALDGAVGATPRQEP